MKPYVKSRYNNLNCFPPLITMVLQNNNMEFKKNIQEKFQEAGWHQGRNVLDKYENIKYFNDFPQILKDFLKEYGILKTKETNPITKDEPCNFIITIDCAEYENEEDYTDDIEIFGIRLFPFGYIEKGGGYRICCDEQGQIYMLGGGVLFFRSKDFITGIERILEPDLSDLHNLSLSV